MSHDPPNLATIAQTLLESTLKTLLHETVLTQHRAHKTLLTSLSPETKLPHCPECTLPRLLDPPLAPKVRGAPDPPPNTQYCDKRPWCRVPGHDIYGNPFPKSDASARPPAGKKGESKAGSKKDQDGTPASTDGPDNPPSPSQNGDADPTPTRPAGGAEKLEKGEKKASKIDEKLKKGEYIPWQTCPSCKRSLLITRFAKHLEACIGLSGRAASRNAMAKMNGSTPSGSGAGTPGPSQDAKEGAEDEGPGGSGSGTGAADKIKGPGGVRKKVLKKGMKEKIRKDTGGKDAPSAGKGKLPKNVKASAPPRASPAPSSTMSVGGEGKRDRDEMLGDEGEDDETVHVQKRAKLQRVMSAASAGSGSTVAAGGGGGGGGGNEIERGGAGGDSNDGSFVDDDGGSGGED